MLFAAQKIADLLFAEPIEDGLSFREDMVIARKGSQVIALFSPHLWAMRMFAMISQAAAVTAVFDAPSPQLFGRGFIRVDLRGSRPSLVGYAISARTQFELRRIKVPAAPLDTNKARPVPSIHGQGVNQLWRPSQIAQGEAVPR
jgi:hypothetical protein